MTDRSKEIFGNVISEKDVKKAAASKAKAKKAEFVIQSPMGGEITTDEIMKKVPKDADYIYVRVDQNKIWWTRGEESGSVDIW